MIEIDSTLLSQQALDNLVTEVIIRQSRDYGEVSKISLATKKALLLKKLERGEAMIVYHAQDGFCDVVKADGKK